MNILKTAARLNLHPNTLYARMDKISQITGLDAKSFKHLSELLIVAQLEKNATVKCS